VFASREALPKAEFLVPVVLSAKALVPTAVLSLAVVLDPKAK
jgi:hypothetical protein